jgi:hypothetical protein
MVLLILKRLLRTLRIGDDGSARNESINRIDVETLNALPDNCLRGLRKASWVDDRFLIATETFLPDSRTAAGRQDGGRETSVNWEDDVQVENFTLSDKRNAQYGAARISKIHIAQTSDTVAAVTKPLSCERNRLPNNKYHGNIVYAAKVNARMEKMLAAALALKSKFIAPPSESVE